MPLVEVELTTRALLYVKDEDDIEAIKSLARNLEDDIMEEMGSYKVLVIPFNPAGWDFDDIPFGLEDVTLTVGEIHEIEQRKMVERIKAEDKL